MADAASLTLNWTDNSNNENGFTIERKTGTTGTFAQIATVSSNTISYTDSNVAAGTTYCYRVDAFNSTVISPYSNEVCATTASSQTFSLTTNRAGTGSGTVTSSPTGINCGATCATNFDSGQVVTLTATSANGSTFAGWSGNADCNDGSVTMNSSMTCTATFNAQQQQFTLSVSKAGTGSGTVTSSPTAINCGATCAANFNSGQVVTLTATSANGSTFAGWSGGGCSGITSCVITMTAARSVTATFNLQTVASTSLVAAILPSSRSVQVGTPATAYATVINTGNNTAKGVKIALNTAIPAGFSFQTTDGANGPTSAPNIPVDIPAGGVQNFVISLTPADAVEPTELDFIFSGTNTVPVGTLVGINTLLFSASATPVPDVVALAATATNDGVVNIPGPRGVGVFAVATINLGSGAILTASADTGDATLPVEISLCETNPETGQCITSIGRTVTTQIDTKATSTFGFFVTGTGSVPLDPAMNRIFVRFNDSNGVVRGSTSVAVRTQ